MAWTGMFQIIIPPVGEDPADQHVNTLYIHRETDGAPVANSTEAIDIASGLAGEFAKFYQVLAANGRFLWGYRQNAAKVKMYNVEGVRPNYPLAEVDMTVPASDTDFKQPPEVALCMSFANDTAVTVPRARRRGRIYLGGVGDSAVGTDGRPTQATIDEVTSTGEILDTNIKGFYGRWVIWSRAAGTWFPVQRIWCDNEFDTQRRRGRKATTRSEVLITT